MGFSDTQNRDFYKAGPPLSSQIMRALGGNPCFEYLKSPF
jgi:hypothetical protein